MDPNLVGKAVKIAAIAHCFQVDKGGRPYILHLLRVMAAMPTDELRVVAVLHDLMEDHPENTQGSLRAAGFPDQIIDALVAITKLRDEPYEQYIDRVRDNALARHVKLYDLKDNLDVRRLPGPATDKDLKRIAKYQWALMQLMYDGGLVEKLAA